MRPLRHCLGFRSIMRQGRNPCKRRARRCCATGSSAPPRAIRQGVHRCGGRWPHADLRPVARRDLPHCGVLRGRGIGANDRIALLSNNSIEHLAVIFRRARLWRDDLHRPCRDEPQSARQHPAGAASPYGAVRGGSGPRRHAQGRGRTVPAAGPVGRLARRQLFCRGQSLRARATPRPTPAPDDSAVILFTSGTSAQPKGVVLSYRELLSNAGPTADGFGLTAQDRIYDYRSFNWCSAQTLSAVPPLCRGATLILGRNSRAAASSITSSNTARRSRPATRPPSAFCSTATALAAGGTDVALHDVEFRAARRRGVAALRGAVRHPRRAGLWLQRDRLDRGAARRAAAHRHGRPAARLPRLCIVGQKARR